MSNTSLDKSNHENSSDRNHDNKIPIFYFKPYQLQLVYNGYICNRVGKEHIQP